MTNLASKSAVLETIPPDISQDLSLERIAHGADVFGRPWARRRVTVVGLGKSGMAAAALLHRIGCRVQATDTRDTPCLRQARNRLKAHYGIKAVELGRHSRHFLAQTELLVVSPGVPESADPIQTALSRGIPVMSEIELAYNFCQAPIVAVTGTSGKSTVVSLIAEVLRAGGLKALACGNLGTPFSSVVGRFTSHSVAVVEISSFQLLWCELFRPKVAMLLNIGLNHLDRHQDRDSYIAAKARLFERQTPADWCVLNGTDSEVIKLSAAMHAQPVWFGENRSNSRPFCIAPETQRALSLNAQAVLQAARLFKIPDPLTWQTIRSFRALAHRMEFVATINGVHFVNDSKSTTPQSCSYALEHTRGEIVLILGGRDKGLDLNRIHSSLKDKKMRGIVLFGESRVRWRQSLRGFPNVHECDTVPEAVRTAATLAHAGTTVLLSPACASFDMFRNFEERGMAFKAAVKKLAATGGLMRRSSAAAFSARNGYKT